MVGLKSPTATSAVARVFVRSPRRGSRRRVMQKPEKKS